MHNLKITEEVTPWKRLHMVSHSCPLQRYSDWRLIILLGQDGEKTYVTLPRHKDHSGSLLSTDPSRSHALSPSSVSWTTNASPTLSLPCLLWTKNATAVASFSAIKCFLSYKTISFNWALFFIFERGAVYFYVGHKFVRQALWDSAPSYTPSAHPQNQIHRLLNISLPRSIILTQKRKVLKGNWLFWMLHNVFSQKIWVALLECRSGVGKRRSETCDTGCGESNLSNYIQSNTKRFLFTVSCELAVVPKAHPFWINWGHLLPLDDFFCKWDTLQNRIAHTKKKGPVSNKDFITYIDALTPHTTESIWAKKPICTLLLSVKPSKKKNCMKVILHLKV